MLHRGQPLAYCFVRSHDLHALVEDSFNTFLQPLSIRLLTVHQQLDCPLERPTVRKFGFQQGDDRLTLVS